MQRFGCQCKTAVPCHRDDARSCSMDTCDAERRERGIRNGFGLEECPFTATIGSIVEQRDGLAIFTALKRGCRAIRIGYRICYKDHLI